MRTKEKHMNIMLFIIIVVVFICFIGYFCSNEILSQDNKTAYADIAMAKTEDEYSIPNDPYFSMQWALSDKYNNISIQQAWEITKGSPYITVGVMDTGISVHEDLEVNIDKERRYNAIRKTNTRNDVVDFHGHGTSVAGIIGAATNNNIGITGIAHEVSIIPLVVADKFGYYSSEAVVRAIEYAIDQDIKILNFSAARFGDDLTVLNAIKKYKGLFIWSAGNFGENVDEFENIEEFDLPNLISVGARDKNSQRSSWVTDKGLFSSNYGEAVDIFAPGGSNAKLNDSSGLIFTTNINNDYTEKFFGTSAAAPHVAGVAALLLSKYPTMTSAQLKHAIIDGSDMIEIDTPDGKQKVRNLNAYGALHRVGVFDTKAISDTEVAITRLCDVKSDCLMIPATYQGKKVTAIADGAFKNNTMLKNVIISESITSIGNEAFAGSSVEKVTFFRSKNELKIGNRAFADCDSLWDITIPNRTTYIGDNAFTDCDSLKEASFESGVLGYLEIGREAFKNCRNIISTYIPTKTSLIGDGAFSGCSKLNSFKIPTIIRNFTVGAQAFENCYELKEIYFPESVYYIGNRAFVGCYNLQKIEFENSFYNRGDLTLGDEVFLGCRKLEYIGFPNHVEQIGKSCFQNCIGLKSVSFYAASQKSLTIGDSAFYNSGLTSLEIPLCVRSIGESAFAECSELTEVNFEEGVNNINIGSNAFYNCKKLVSVTIPNTVSTLGAGAFGNCTALSEITLWNKFTEISDELFSGCSALEKVAIHGKITKIGNYAFSQCTSLTNIEFDDISELQTIGNYAYNGTAIKTANIPNTVTYIGTGAFGNCSGLTNMVLPSGITEINDELFSGCSNLGQVTIHGKITRIGNSAFSQCTSLSTVEFDDIGELQTIGNHAFDSTLIVAIDIPDSVATIGNNAFAWCTRLTSVGISKDSGLISVGDYAFDNTAISEVYLPDTVTSIGKCAFRNCEFLTSVTLPKNIESIEDGVFYGCANLTEAVIPSGVISIGESAFGSCKKLDSIVLPSALNYIGVSAFEKCVKLSGLIIPTGVETIETCAFVDCNGLIEIIIPNTVTRLGISVFRNCSGLESLFFESGSHLSYIPNGMCMFCKKLERANIPTSVTEIGSYAFYNCFELKYQPFDYDGNLNKMGNRAFFGCPFKEVVLPIKLKEMAGDTFGESRVQEIYITNTTEVIQTYSYYNFIDCTMLDAIYVYDVCLAMEYKTQWEFCKDKIVTVSFDWAFVTDSDHIPNKYKFDYTFDYDKDFNELMNVIEDQAVNGVLFYLSTNEFYDLSGYADIFRYDYELPVIVLSLGGVYGDDQYTVIYSDEYSLGFSIAESYLAKLSEKINVYGYFLDKEFIPVIVPHIYKYNLSFLMGLYHVFGIPVKAVEKYDELIEWKNEDGVYFENWLCFIDGTNADIVRASFDDNMDEYYVCYGFSYSRQYLSKFENKFVIKNTSVITDIAEKHILGESYDFIDYTFYIDTGWIENNVNTDYDRDIIDWYVNEWIDELSYGIYSVFLVTDIDLEKKRYADILEFYADKSAYISDNNVCYIARTVTYIDPYM